MSEDTQIVVAGQSRYISPITSVGSAIEMHRHMSEYIKSALREGVDFGKIPGAGDKPTLLKPGAEKLTKFFGISVRLPKDLQTNTLDWTGEDHNGEPFFYFAYTAQAWSGDLLVAECEGSANSWEKKYRYRQADPVCPICGKTAIMKSKKDPGYYCWSKKGGCGAQFPGGDTRITKQDTGMVKNPDPAEVVNTLQKMAQKRAIVGVTLLACNASEYFTQDIEDMDFPGVWTETDMGSQKQTTPPTTTATVTPPAPQTMSLETAKTATDSKGNFYHEVKDNEKLSFVATSLRKSLAINGLTQEEHDEKQFKLEAILTILASRQEA